MFLASPREELTQEAQTSGSTIQGREGIHLFLLQSQSPAAWPGHQHMVFLGMRTSVDSCTPGTMGSMGGYEDEHLNSALFYPNSLQLTPPIVSPSEAPRRGSMSQASQLVCSHLCRAAEITTLLD